jgi:hypothetical protein
MRAKRPAANGNRGKTTWIQGELAPTAFRLVLSAGKLNLPLVPSQDYVFNMENTIANIRILDVIRLVHGYFIFVFLIINMLS